MPACGACISWTDGRRTACCWRFSPTRVSGPKSSGNSPTDGVGHHFARGGGTFDDAVLIDTNRQHAPVLPIAADANFVSTFLQRLANGRRNASFQIQAIRLCSPWVERRGEVRGVDGRGVDG